MSSSSIAWKGQPKTRSLLIHKGPTVVGLSPTPVLSVYRKVAAPGEDLRTLPLLERKRRLRRVVPRGKRSHRLRYLDYIEADGALCTGRVRGILRESLRSAEAHLMTPRRLWVKIKNPAYTQAEEREEFF
jgi:ATP-dependent DNA ligase